MWSRLIYLDLKKSFNPVKKGVVWHPPLLSGKYRRRLIKEFRKVNLPLFFTKIKTNEKNNYQKKPKDSKYEIFEKPEKEQRIRNALLKADEEILKHRQTFLNNRKYKGVDRMFQEIMPDWADLAKSRNNEERI